MKTFIISRGIPSKDYPLYGIFEYDQAKALAKNGIDTSMLVIDFRSLAYKRKYGFLSYEKDNVKIFELSLPLGMYRRALPLLQRLLYLLYKKTIKIVGRPDVVHAHFYSIAAIASFIKKKDNVPFIVTEHSSKLNKAAAHISNIDKSLTMKAYSQADAIISVSKTLSSNIKDNFGFESHIIHNMIDLEHSNYSKKNDNESFTFISVGNLISRKGFDILIKAFKKAFADDSKVCLNIIGEGEERIHLQNIINECNISDRVRLLGQKTRTELFELMRKGDAFVLASKIETFGVVYIEAMVCGLPVIATRCGGPEDFVNDTNGILIPTDDIEALSKALIDMRLNIDNFDSKKISEECYNKFSSENIAEQIVEQYYKVVEK
ncbi:MAG: glycosyltransferase family 4 protein [Lentimicrobiaceae bacterium]|nr:glycosyltransferase family 4 protein [Lentimicrobiaceae bacterium]